MGVRAGVLRPGQPDPFVGIPRADIRYGYGANLDVDPRDGFCGQRPSDHDDHDCDGAPSTAAQALARRSPSLSGAPVNRLVPIPMSFLERLFDAQWPLVLRHRKVAFRDDTLMIQDDDGTWPVPVVFVDVDAFASGLRTELWEEARP